MNPVVGEPACPNHELSLDVQVDRSVIDRGLRAYERQRRGDGGPGPMSIEPSVSSPYKYPFGTHAWLFGRHTAAGVQLSAVPASWDTLPFHVASHATAVALVFTIPLSPIVPRTVQSTVAISRRRRDSGCEKRDACMATSS